MPVVGLIAALATVLYGACSEGRAGDHNVRKWAFSGSKACEVIMLC